MNLELIMLMLVIGFAALGLLLIRLRRIARQFSQAERRQLRRRPGKLIRAMLNAEKEGQRLRAKLERELHPDTIYEKELAQARKRLGK